jgi:hypothetical protein
MLVTPARALDADRTTSIRAVAVVSESVLRAERVRWVRAERE